MLQLLSYVSVCLSVCLQARTQGGFGVFERTLPPAKKVEKVRSRLIKNGEACLAKFVPKLHQKQSQKA